MASLDAARRLAPADLAAGMQAAFNWAHAGGLTVALLQMACNRTVWACGCVTWHELLPGGSWITRSWPCSRHDHG